jgi:hypothetical protein
MSTLSASDLASLQASSTHILTLGSPADQSANSLDVGIPATLGTTVRVRNIVPEARNLAANIAGGSHDALQFFDVSPLMGKFLRRVTDDRPGNPVGEG